MIKILNVSDIGFVPKMGERLHVTIDNLRSLYANKCGDYSKDSAVIGLSGEEFYIIWSKFPCKVVWGRIDSQQFYDTLDFFISQEK